MEILKRLLGRGGQPQDEGPLTEHPTGRFRTAREAIEFALQRLGRLEHWDDWICFSGQGQGEAPDSCHIADIRLRGDTRIRVEGASAAQMAAVLDAVSRTQLGTRPFDGEEDYAVGAEW